MKKKKDDISLPKFKRFEQFAVISSLKESAKKELEKKGIVTHKKAPALYRGFLSI